jgi:hypothetical protein
MLAQAFRDDPAFGWMFPAQRSRHRRTRRYFLTELHHESLRHGAVEVARIDGRVAGAAGWFPPVRNVPLYEHFGFQLTGALGLPADAPVVNTMWRPGESSPV